MREIKFRAWITNKMWDDEKKAEIGGGKMIIPKFLKSVNGNYKVQTLDCCIKCNNDENGCYHLKYEVDDYLDGGLYTIPAILMQFTGLKDKNGVAIYEGDILKRQTYKKSGLLNGNAYVIIKDIRANRYRKENHLSNMVIVGNIYQNPELIKGEKSE